MGTETARRPGEVRVAEQKGSLELRVGTNKGLAKLIRRDGLWTVEKWLLKESDVNVVVHKNIEPDIIFAGTYGQGLLRSVNGGQSWEKLDVPDLFIRAIAFGPADPETIYVGTEPANLYRSRDGGDSWEDLRIRRLRGSAKWSLPYSPRAGALRTIVLPGTEPCVIYGGVEQGGVIKSTDYGKTWSLCNNGIHPDVHLLAIDPVNPNKLFAATGGGVFATMDAAGSWMLLFEEYTRAIIIDRDKPAFVLAGPARDVGEGGNILSSMDGGQTWSLAQEGAQFPLADMVELFAIEPGGNTIYAILSDGGLLKSAPDPIRWSEFEQRLACIQTLDFV